MLINGLSVRILRRLQQHVLQLLHIYLHVPQAKPVPAAAVATLEAQESTLIAGRWDGSWMKTGPFLACGFYKDSKCSDDDTEQFLVGPYLTLYLGYLGLAWLNGGGGAFAFAFAFALDRYVVASARGFALAGLPRVSGSEIFLIWY